MFTHVHPCLPVFTDVYLVFTDVYLCLLMFTYVYPCLLSTIVLNSGDRPKKTMASTVYAPIKPTLGYFASFSPPLSDLKMKAK